MRTENIEAKFIMSIPFDKPDENGNIYTREAIEKAICDFNNNGLPLIYRNNEEYSSDEVIGVVKILPDVIWDDENQICKIEVDGNIFYGGTGCIVNEMLNDKVINILAIICELRKY